MQPRVSSQHALRSFFGCFHARLAPPGALTAFCCCQLEPALQHLPQPSAAGPPVGLLPQPQSCEHLTFEITDACRTQCSLDAGKFNGGMPNTALPPPEAGLRFGDQQQTYLLISFLVSLHLTLRGHGAVLCICALVSCCQAVSFTSAKHCVLVVISK